MKLTSSEQNYLLAIDRIADGGRVSTNELAAAIGLSAASVTDMIQKLADKGLVDYQKYHGVELLPQGRNEVNRLKQQNQLWSQFLEEELQYNGQDKEEVLDELTHIQSKQLTKSLQNFLVSNKTLVAPDQYRDEIPFPSYDAPQESPKSKVPVQQHINTRQQQFFDQIEPKKEAKENSQIIESRANKQTLANCLPGDRVFILGLSDWPQGMEHLITQYQLTIGAEVRLIQIFDFDSSVLIQNNESKMVIGQKLAQLILIRKIN